MYTYQHAHAGGCTGYAKETVQHEGKMQGKCNYQIEIYVHINVFTRVHTYRRMYWP